MTKLSSPEELAQEVSTPEFERDPYPVFQLMLDCPPWRAPSGAFVVAKHASVHDVLINHEVFGQHLAPWPNFHRLNPPEHTRLRRLLSSAFSPRSIKELRSEIEQASQSLLEEVDSEFDIISQYAFHLPARIMAGVIGVPYEDAGLWYGWLQRMGQFNFENPFSFKDASWHDPIVADATKANREQAEYFIDIIRQRREHLGDDIVSRLINAREDDDSLSDEEVLYALVLLLQGGLHTTVHQIGNTMRALLQNTAQFDLLRDDPNLIPSAVEEGLRFDGTLRTEIRVVRKDTTLEGVELSEGDDVITVHAAANRDPRVFEVPDEFDIRRVNANAHLGFGFGVHFCIGAPLARSEMVVAIRDLASLPGLRLAGEPQGDNYFRVGGLASLPVAWNRDSKQ
jgi:cytochrome P450